MLLERESGILRVEATYGLNLDQARRATYKIGKVSSVALCKAESPW
jgi:hypothetical protein